MSAAAGSSQPVSPFRLRLARDLLRAGALVAYPTEGVFGIGCDPRNPHALSRVVALKGRAAGKGLILVGCSEQQVAEFANLAGAADPAAVRSSWPGPVTWVLPARRGVARLVTGGRATVAVRVTAHPVAAALCRAFGGALVSTSANLSGRAPARTALAVRRRLGPQAVDLVLCGAVGGLRGASTIRDGASGRVLRGAP